MFISFLVVESKKLRFVSEKEVVPLPGSQVKTINGLCESDCMRECSHTAEVAGCAESPEGTCTIVSSGGVVLRDKSGHKAIINGDFHFY